MTVDERIRAIVARLGKHPDPAALPADADVFRELGVKSTAALDLLLSLEDEFGVHIPDDAFNDARTIARLAALVSGR